MGGGAGEEAGGLGRQTDAGASGREDERSGIQAGRRTDGRSGGRTEKRAREQKKTDELTVGRRAGGRTADCELPPRWSTPNF